MTWSNKPLESLIERLESGSRPTGGASSDGGEVFSIGGENILQSGGVTLDAVKRIPVAFFNHMSKGHLRADDVLINKDGAQTGKVGWYQPGRDLVACINEHVFLLRGEPDRITQGYLYYSLLSDPGQAQIRLQISGSAQPGLKIGFTKGVTVKFPTDIREQSMVVRVLSTVDRAIEQTEVLIAKQQRIKTGLMQDLLTRGIDQHGNLRSEQTHNFKDSPLGRIPEQWGTLRLDQLTRRDSPITYGVVQPGPPDENGVRFVRGGDIYDGIVRMEQLRTISRTISATYKRTVLEGGELVMSLVGYPGEVAVIPTSLAGSNIARQVALVRLASVHDARFVMFYLMSIPGKQQVFGSTLGSAQQVVNLKDLRTVIVPRPAPAEEGAIRERVDALYDEIEAQAHSLKKLVLLKRGLMQDLLTGNRRVTPLLEQREGVAT